MATPSVRAADYASGVLAGEIIACKWVQLACQRFVDDLKRSETDPDWPFEYSLEKGDAAVVFMERLPHLKGRWAKRKQLFHMEPWQCFIECNIFGWVHRETGLRRFTNTFEVIPRKNGKSFRVAARGMYIFCVESEEEPGMECISGAGTEKQAWYVFKNVREWPKQNEKMKERFGITVAAKSIMIEDSASKFEPVIGKPGDGGGYAFAVVDEYHEHPDDTLYETVETGQAAIEQPLLSVITTAGSNLGGPCFDRQLEIQKILEGSVTDDRAFGIIFGIDDGDDWDTEEALIKANPNWDISVSPDFLRGQLAQARRSATKQNAYRTKHLNQWVGSKVSWMNMLAWRRQRKQYDMEQFRGARAFLGVDLASKVDLAALAILIPWQGKFYTFFEFWCPEERVTQNDKYQDYPDHITSTPGEAVDYDFIELRIKELCEFFDVADIAFDQWQAQQMMTRLEKAGLPVTVFPHQVRTMSDPMKEIEARVLDRSLFHNNPVIDWMMGNVVVRMDEKENIYPTKERKNDPKCKIDGVVSLIMAKGLYCAAKDEGSLDDWLNDPLVVS